MDHSWCPCPELCAEPVPGLSCFILVLHLCCDMSYAALHLLHPKIIAPENDRTVWAGRDFKSHLVQPLCQRQGHFQLKQVAQTPCVNCINQLGVTCKLPEGPQSHHLCYWWRYWTALVPLSTPEGHHSSQVSIRALSHWPLPPGCDRPINSRSTKQCTHEIHPSPI